ncbi:DNA-binding response OmpR family regulator [Kitasatospora gansuensis]|uniref:DNA-binding response OmpR family regulator n=1 Tax=Kitasatospora gansuensis TaxID=258050 RepID=A0A7W7SDF8_9ACTN|nr:response regulator transcription factor [Kitasatospora gansuensis]MBB4948456.1 DNA-binding response OmpR family regulator [Kitasatospora gansuensis]
MRNGFIQPMTETIDDIGADITWRVLVVESDSRDREIFEQGLSFYGCKVSAVSTGREALDAFREVDLVLLGLDLADRDGLEICRMIRAASDTPIIAITARGAERDAVLGLRAGADDYVVKPCGSHELAARIDAVMRRVRVGRNAERVIEHGCLRIDTGRREVTLKDRTIKTTKKEFELLHLLASHPGTVLSRETIMRQVWGASWSRRTIDTHVSSIRTKLGRNDWIITVRGVGFMMA